MSPEDYDLFVAGCDIASREYSILKNGIIASDQSDRRQRRVIEILCDKDEAVLLLGAATELYPALVPAITEAIRLARE